MVKNIQLEGDLQLSSCRSCAWIGNDSSKYKGEVWVASGDYKIGHDSFGNHFEPIPCHTFITESTFGLPYFAGKRGVFDAINAWWKKNQTMGYTSVVYAYSLGKAQRVLQGIDDIGPVVPLRRTKAQSSHS